MVKYIWLWFPMLIIAIANGAARDLWLRKFMDEMPSRQLSTITLMVFFGVYVWFVMVKFPPQSAPQAIYIGLLWMAMTLIFEFGFGLSRGNPMRDLLAEYNIIRGKLWVLVPIWVAISPYIMYKITK